MPAPENQGLPPSQTMNGTRYVIEQGRLLARSPQHDVNDAVDRQRLERAGLDRLVEPIEPARRKPLACDELPASAEVLIGFQLAEFGRLGDEASNDVDELAAHLP